MRKEKRIEKDDAGYLKIHRRSMNVDGIMKWHASSNLQSKPGETGSKSGCSNNFDSAVGALGLRPIRSSVERLQHAKVGYLTKLPRVTEG